ncbi:DUF308 domain-containing protein [Streptomyces sp. R41]|uniref:DUF308 domain-containing protein n=1 Tax=Streptomyces sp. R41 TaxID=3238632 RepID=A0AB39RWR4_9ACTN
MGSSHAPHPPSYPHPRPVPAGAQDLDQDVYPGVLGLLARFAWQRQVAMGVVTLVLGVLALAWPGATVLVVGVLFGIYLPAYGVVQLTVALQPASVRGRHTRAPTCGELLQRCAQRAASA